MPSQSSVLVLLGLVASIQAVPAARPDADAQVARQITLDPPTYTISWEIPLPSSSTDSETPGEPSSPPLPSDSITLSPPTATVTWDGPQPPTTTKKPGWPFFPWPTKKTTTSRISATVSWGKRQFEYEPEPTDAPEEPEEPENPGDGGIIIIPPGFPPVNPPDTVTFAPPTATIIWGKRQFQTDFPDDPEEPEDPGDGGIIIIPPGFPPVNPPDTVTFAPPTATISWGKRQFQTDFPEDPEDPEDPDDGGPIVITPQPQPNPPDTVTFAPPTATITWGKRQTNDFTLAPAKPSMTWGKRQDEPEDPIPEPTEITNPLPPAPTDDVTLSPPEASITWGKRDDAAAADWPPPTWWLGPPSATVIWPFPGRPTASISWGKRAPEPTEAALFTCGTTNTVTSRVPCATYSCGRECSLLPGSVTVRPPVIDTTTIPDCPLTATASNICDRCVCPTTLIPHPSASTVTPNPPTHHPTKPTATCKTLTSTIVPPCIPPTCSSIGYVACRIAAPEGAKREAIAEENKMADVSLTTVTVPAPRPTKTEGGKCPTPLPTKTYFAGCPKYSCVPHGECGTGGARRA